MRVLESHELKAVAGGVVTLNPVPGLPGGPVAFPGPVHVPVEGGPITVSPIVQPTTAPVSP